MRNPRAPRSALSRSKSRRYPVCSVSRRRKDAGVVVEYIPLPNERQRIEVVFTKPVTYEISEVLDARSDLKVSFKKPGARLLVKGAHFTIVAAEGDGILKIHGSGDINFAPNPHLGDSLQVWMNRVPALIGRDTKDRHALVILETRGDWYEIVPGKRWAQWTGVRVRFSSSRPKLYEVEGESISTDNLILPMPQRRMRDVF